MKALAAGTAMLRSPTSGKGTSALRQPGWNSCDAAFEEHNASVALKPSRTECIRGHWPGAASEDRAGAPIYLQWRHHRTRTDRYCTALAPFSWLVARARYRVPFSASTRSLCCLDAGTRVRPVDDRAMASSRENVPAMVRTDRPAFKAPCSQAILTTTSSARAQGAGRAFLCAVLHRGCGRSCASRRHRRRAIQGWQMPYRVRDAISRKRCLMPPAGTMSGGSWRTPGRTHPETFVIVRS